MADSLEPVYAAQLKKKNCLSSQICIIIYILIRIKLYKTDSFRLISAAIKGALSDLPLGIRLYVIFFLRSCLHAAKLLVDKTIHIMIGSVYAFIKRKNIMATSVAERLDSSLTVHHAHQQSDRLFLNLEICAQQTAN